MIDLITLNINTTLLLNDFIFSNQENNIECLNQQAIDTKDLELKLELLNQATSKIEKFHSYFHFEQSYFNLHLAILLRNNNDEENAIIQLDAAIFQDHLNLQAKQLLSFDQVTEIYHRPFESFEKYLSFASEENTQDSSALSFWTMKDKSIEELNIIVEKIRAHHLSYHQEAAKLYLNRALVFHQLHQFELANNDLVKAANLDVKVKEQDYYAMILLQMSTQVVLGLGSNLGNRDAYLKQAIAKLEELNILQNITCSSIAESKADLKPNSPEEWNLDYLNMAIIGYTRLSPQQLLRKIKDIEQVIGRKENLTWSPREIDIDILAYANEIIEHDDLQIPHPRLHERPWAIAPFIEIHPNWKHPILNKTISEMK